MMTAASISIVTFMIEKANVIFNIPEKLMQDVKNYVEVEAQALDVPMKGGKAADGDRIRRVGEKIYLINLMTSVYTN